jgi:molybdate-binding protein/transcriptional regulator with XRE-family HTH domain
MKVSLTNRVAELRRASGLSQNELALASGISRAEVSAVETGRLVPSTAAALKLAVALGGKVEELFRLSDARDESPSWAFPPGSDSGRFWEARVGPRTLLYPVEPTSGGLTPHDGTFRAASIERTSGAVRDRTLVVAGCDPAVGLLASELRAASGVRLIALNRGSREALALLKRGLVHAAGLHWSEESREDANASVVAKTLGPGFRLLHQARWEEGVALGPSVTSRSTRALRRSRIRWVAREEGSGARRCMDRLLGGKRFRHVAADHRGVAQAIRCGWAEAGVAVRLAAEEAGLGFLEVQREDYDLCYSESLREEPAIAALRKVLRSSRLRKLYRDLPGYDVDRMGEEREVA